MCGVFGVLSLDGHPLVEARTRLSCMAQALHHRGPDGARILTSPLFAIGASRLAIIDLSVRATQPFTSPDHRIWLACNGEIYNSPALRRRHPAYHYASNGDLEPLLPLLAARGTGGLADIDGMFALAAWDETRQQLILARDRAGEKPLFVAERDSELWFASEIGALLTLPGIGREIDPIALSQYLRLGYALEPRTLFAAIRRVESGTALVVCRGAFTVQRYWDPGETAAARPAGDLQPVHARVAHLRELLTASVRRQLVADVPVGVFTSGGLDSSLLAVLAGRELGTRVSTFSARFPQASYDESGWARRCARIAGTRHREVDCTDEALREAFRALQEHSAEPISDPAVLPTWLLARAAHEDVRVVLTGEGADELFGGYPTYVGHRLAPAYRSLPGPVRRALEQGIARLPFSSRKVPAEMLLRRFVAGVDLDWVERHVEWTGAGLPEAPLPPLAKRVDTWLTPWLAQQREHTPLPGALVLDYCTSLREKLLVKTDRALMAHSVEGRMPYLDHELTRFALRLPATDRVRGLTTKWLLKQAARQWLPSSLIHRTKRGLSVPVAALINGALRSDSDRLLRPQSPATTQLFDGFRLRSMLIEHRLGGVNHARLLWPALALAAWAERWQAVLPEEAFPPAGRHPTPTASP